MSTIIDLPGIIDAPKFFDDLDTEDKDILGNDSNFPDAVIMLRRDDGKYCAVNVTTPEPDPMTVSALVCFATDKEAEFWEAKYMTGEHVNKSFQEARDLCISKNNIHALALQVNGETQHLHWVR